MPKKTRKARRKERLAPIAPAALSEAKTEVAAAPTVPRPVAAARATSAPKVDLAQEYYYVFSDLSKIGIIAAVMFALLFVLAFVLR